MLKLLVRLQKKYWLPLLLIAGAAAPSLLQAATTSYFNTVFAFDGSLSLSGVIQGTDGALYGSTYNTSLTSGGLIFRTTVDGDNPQTLYQLGTNSADGYSPRADLLLATDGYFYGTTHFGPRAGSNYNRGAGTLFRMTQDGKIFETIHYFADMTDSTALTNTDGVYPDAALIEGLDGYLYGVTVYGGENGTGTVFRTSKNGLDFTVLHEFAALDDDGFNAEGAYPGGKLLLASDGNLYGVTTGGGEAGYGAIYKLSTDGSGFEAIYSFADLDDDGLNADGATPRGALVEGSEALYGVTSDGGNASYGTIYELETDGTASGTTLTTLHQFAGSTDTGADGAIPTAGLVFAEEGRLFGTTSAGSSSSNGSYITSYGTIFAINTDGSDYEVLHIFGSSQGSSPQSELLRVDATTYFGTTAASGPCGYGTVFRLSLTGNLSSNGKTSCEETDSGSGSMGGGLLLLLSALGLAPSLHRRFISVARR